MNQDRTASAQAYAPGINAFNALMAKWREKGDLEGLEFRLGTASRRKSPASPRNSAPPPFGRGGAFRMCCSVAVGFDQA